MRSRDNGLEAPHIQVYSLTIPVKKTPRNPGEVCAKGWAGLEVADKSVQKNIIKVADSMFQAHLNSKSGQQAISDILAMCIHTYKILTHLKG